MAEKPIVEPRWPAFGALVAVGALFYAMPPRLTLGPEWLVLALNLILLVPITISHRMGNARWNEIFAYTNLAMITAALISSVVLLVTRLPEHRDTPIQLLRGATSLWVCNVLVFASWYWRLDGGGPNQRDRRGVHRDGAFLFPQMIMDDALRKQMGEDEWTPGFVDYLFLAYNTSTAFSPTDVPVLSRWAKALMMVQSSISLVTVVLLAARAVNIL